MRGIFLTLDSVVLDIFSSCGKKDGSRAAVRPEFQDTYRAGFPDPKVFGNEPRKKDGIFTEPESVFTLDQRKTCSPQVLQCLCLFRVTCQTQKLLTMKKEIWSPVKRIRSLDFTSYETISPEKSRQPGKQPRRNHTQDKRPG